MNIKLNKSSLNVSSKLLKQLNKQIELNGVTDEDSEITINFRDLSYSAKEGGYHPVEISMRKDLFTSNWDLLYITDFAFYGLHYPELCMEFDFNFELKVFFMINCGSRSLSDSEVKGFYKLWQTSFISSLESDVFDEIEVSSY